MSAPWLWRNWLRLWSRLRQRELWLAAVVVVLVLFGAWRLSDVFAGVMLQAEQVRAWILSFGPYAPLVYISVYSIQILLAPLPGQFIAIMGGYLFGALFGLVYSLAGMSIGAGLAMWLARRYGRPLLERFFEPVRLRRWERKMHARSLFTWWVLFLFPMPDLVFYVAGLSTMPLRKLLFALITGRGLGLLVATSVGQMTAVSQPERVLLKWAVIGVLGGVLYFYQRRLRLILLLTVRRIRHQRGLHAQRTV